MKLPRRRRAEICEPRANSKLMELETAKEIQVEIFHTQPGEVEEMIQRRLEETKCPEEKEIWLCGSQRKGKVCKILSQHLDVALWIFSTLF